MDQQFTEDLPLPEQQLTNSVSIGTQLKKARNEKKLTVQQVASEMHLASHIISQLEQDDFNELPATYAKGYLRSYAKLLHLDADAIVAQFDRTRQHVEHDPFYRSHIEKEQAEKNNHFNASDKTKLLQKFAFLGKINFGKIFSKIMSFKNIILSTQSGKSRYAIYGGVVVFVIAIIIFWSSHHHGQSTSTSPVTATLTIAPPQSGESAPQQNTGQPQSNPAPASNDADSDITSKLQMDNY